MPRARRNSSPTAEEQLKEQESEELLNVRNWLSSLGDTTEFRCKLDRVEPVTDSDGNKIKGYLDEVPLDHLDEELIKKRYGGGKYKLRIINSAGQFKHSKTLEISGQPKSTTPVVAASEKKESDSIVERALSTSERIVTEERAAREKAEARLYEASHSSRPDPAIDILRDQLNNAREELRELRKAATERPAHESRLLEIMAGGRNSEISTIRETHASELRALREHQSAEIRTMNERFDRQLDAIREDTKRQLSEQRVVYEGRIQTLEGSYNSQISLLSVQLEHARTEAKQAKTDLAKLQQEKNKSPVDTITELATLKEKLSSLTGGDSEDDTPTWERVLEKVSESPLLQSIASRLGTAQAIAEAPRPAQLQSAPAKPAEPSPEVQQQQAEIVKALLFTESAISARNTTPEAFARTAKQSLPKELLEELVSRGSGAFIDEVARIRPDSVICTVHGRQFLSQVVKHLKSDSVEEAVQS